MGMPPQVELPYRYQLYGWPMISARPLPFMPPWPDAASTEEDSVEVRFGPVAVPADTPVYDDGFIALHADGSALLTYPEVRIAVAGGRTIRVDAPTDISDAYLHSCLSGAAMSVTSHQRGQPPLHACVLDIDGKGIAIAGHSGFGKSTTARALLLRGHRLVSDDHAQVDPATRLAQAAFPSMKLWTNSADHLGDTLDPAMKVSPMVGKYHLPLRESFRPTPIALTTVVILHPEPKLEHPTLRHLTTQEAAMALHHLVHRWRLAHAIDKGAAAFHWALALSQMVPVVILKRPDDLHQLDRLCAMIEGLAASTDRRTEPVR